MIEGKRIMSQSIPRNKQKKAYSIMEVPHENFVSHADLFHSAAEYLWTTDLFSEGLILYDQHGVMVQMNACATAWFASLEDSGKQPFEQQLTHLAPTDMHGTPLDISDLPPFQLLRENIPTASESCEVIFHLPDGHTLPLNINGTRLYDQQHQVCGVILVLHDLTERIAQEQTSQLEAILEAMPDALIVYDCQGYPIRVNKAGRQLKERLGLADQVHSPIHELARQLKIYNERGNIMQSEALPDARILQGETLTLEQPIDLMLHDAQGQAFFLNVLGVPLYDVQRQISGGILLGRDITERKRAEQTLQEQTRRQQEAERQARAQATQLEAILEAVPDTLLVYDREGRVTHTNKAGKRHLDRLQAVKIASASIDERSRELILYTAQGEFVPPEEWPIAKILRGETISTDNALDLMMTDSQNQKFFLSISGGPLLDEHGDCCGGVFIGHDITEHIQTEHRLQEQAQRLQTQADLINLAKDAIFVCDTQHRIISWNQGAEHLYGWSADEACGQMAPALLQTVFPIPLNVLMVQLYNDNRWEGHLIHTRKDGTQVIVESRWAIVRDKQGRPTALLKINRDITERLHLEQLQQQLHAETEARRNLLQTILDFLPTSVSLLRGPDACLILTNQATTALFGTPWLEGQSMQTALQEHHLQPIPGDGRDPQVALQEALAGKAIDQLQGILNTTNRGDIPILINAVPFDLRQLYPTSGDTSSSNNQKSRDENRALLVVVQDIRIVKEAEQLKDEFISLAAHELRTPLTILGTYMQLLQKRLHKTSTVTEQTWETLTLIEQARKQLLAQAEQMLDITRMQAGRLKIVTHPVELVEAVREVIARLQITTTIHQISLEHIPEQLMVLADRGRLEQILTNLLSNAIKYSPNGGKVDVAIWEEPNAEEARLQIHDEGVGIPAHQQAHLFERFVRGENVQQIGGNGLGLYLSRMLIELQGGRIWFESQEGAGSTFFLAFPLLTHDQQHKS